MGRRLHRGPHEASEERLDWVAALRLDGRGGSRRGESAGSRSTNRASFRWPENSVPQEGACGPKRVGVSCTTRAGGRKLGRAGAGQGAGRAGSLGVGGGHNSDQPHCGHEGVARMAIARRELLELARRELAVARLHPRAFPELLPLQELSRALLPPQLHQLSPRLGCVERAFVPAPLAQSGETQLGRPRGAATRACRLLLVELALHLREPVAEAILVPAALLEVFAIPGLTQL